MRIARTGNRWRLLGFGREIHGCLEMLSLQHGYRVGAVCRELGVSAAYFRELFLRDVGQTPKEWMRTERMMVARRMLEGGMRSPEVAEAVGFSKSESFAREFRQLHGMPPVIFLKSHPKEHV